VTPADSHYRRALPIPLIPFASDEGRTLFGEALEAGTMESFFPLIEQFHTQTDPAFCGLGSLVMALNALGSTRSASGGVPGVGLDPSALPELLGREVLLLRSQLEFLLEHARCPVE
jgi:hypothetical protein